MKWNSLHCSGEEVEESEIVIVTPGHIKQNYLYTVAAQN